MNPKSSPMQSIVLLRAVAVLIVMYDHLIGMWLSNNNMHWTLAYYVEGFLDSIGIMMHGGAFAVALFFLVSGFIIPYVGRSEARTHFILKRFFRIYPPFCMSIVLLVSIFILLKYLNIPTTNLAEPRTIMNVLASATLANYLLGLPSINGVAWTLIIEIIFYIWVALLLGILYKRPYSSVCLILFLSVIILYFARMEKHFFLFAVCNIYIYYMMLGLLIYLRWSNNINKFFFTTATVSFWFLFLKGIDGIIVQPPYTVTGYAISYGLAYILFSIILLLEENIRVGIFFSFFSNISYSLYLYHGGIGLLIISLVFPYTGYALALGLALLIIFFISIISYKYVELPSIAFARNLIMKD